jgi:hypothetical protein
MCASKHRSSFRSPNPRLQRTRATRSPLSRQPLGRLGVVVILAVSACASSHGVAPIAPPRELSVPELGVSEAAFRSFFTEPKYPVANPKLTPCVSFLELEKADPPRALFERLADVRCELRPGSKFKVKSGHGLVSIKTITWTSATSAHIEGMVYVNPELAHGWEAEATLKDDRWSITQLHWTWIT